MLSYKFRIYPTLTQVKRLNAQLEACRVLYNHFLSQRKNDYEINKKQYSAFDQIRQLPTLKKEYPDLVEYCYHDILQDVAFRLDLAFQAFFKRMKNGDTPGYPRFKSQGRYNSVTYTRWTWGCRFKQDKLRLSKIGLVKINRSRELIGKPKTATIIKRTNKWYIIISCDNSELKPVKKQPKNIVAMDLGITNFITFNNGKTIENPRFFEKQQKRLAREQRRNSKNPSEKLKNRIRKIHEKIKNQRENFAHQLSRKLINKYDLIIVEDLSINQILQKRWCSKQIADAAWRSFINKLEYKAENAGKWLIKVNPAYTSQTCSECGCRYILKLSDRDFSCDCGYSTTRDHNAAKNILTLGLQSLTQV